MEGYGRILLTIIFLLLMIGSLVSKYYTDRDDFWITIYALILLPFGCLLIFGVGYFIFNYW
jgi:cytochrome c oxidase subunit IV